MTSNEVTSSQWYDGLSMEGLAYAEQPKVMVKVVCHRPNPNNSRYSMALPATEHDITDWLQAHPEEQLHILKQIEDVSDLDTIDEHTEMDDQVSGDHLVGLEEPKLPAGEAGTDIYLVSAYLGYLRQCRDRELIPFSDHAGHAKRVRAARHRALNAAHAQITAAVDNYTALAQENAAAEAGPVEMATLTERDVSRRTLELVNAASQKVD